MHWYTDFSFSPPSLPPSIPFLFSFSSLSSLPPSFPGMMSMVNLKGGTIADLVSMLRVSGAQTWGALKIIDA